jgi:activating signal cointegrator complex subunit 1
VVSAVNNIIRGFSDAQISESRDQSLRALVVSSIELSRLLRVQRAVFTVVMPSIEDHQRTMFDAGCMEDIGGEDEETLHEREIKCVAFPGIVKSGDENGERGHLRNVVAKIRVLCSPD